jgi:hypothetical protein
MSELHWLYVNFNISLGMIRSIGPMERGNISLGNIFLFVS